MIDTFLAWAQSNPILCALIAFYIYRFWKSRQPMEEVEGSKVVKIKSKPEFDAFVKEGVVVIDFFATWCPPCRSAAPVFARMSIEEKYASSVKFGKVNVDELKQVAAQASISAMPTFKVYIDGAEVGSQQGWSESSVRKMIDDAAKKND